MTTTRSYREKNVPTYNCRSMKLDGNTIKYVHISKRNKRKKVHKRKIGSDFCYCIVMQEWSMNIIDNLSSYVAVHRDVFL